MTKIKSLLFLCSLFIFPVVGNNCSCAEYIETFCAALPAIDSSSTGIYVVSARVATEPHGEFGQYMEVEIMEQLHNTIEVDTITIIGQDGVNCAESLSYFSVDNEIICYLYPEFFDAASPDTFYLDGCGRSWLRLEEGQVNGPIQEDMETQDYETFKEDLYECAGISTSLDDLENVAAQVQIFPNPVQDVLHLQSSAIAIESIRIFSTTGQQVLARTADLYENTAIDMSDLSAGLYFINIEIAGEVVTKKLVKNIAF